MTPEVADFYSHVCPAGVFEWKDDALVVNADDAWATAVAARSPAQVLEFSATRPVAAGAYLDGADLAAIGYAGDDHEEEKEKEREKPRERPQSDDGDR